MIRGILTFKPLASGEVQIMIKGKAEDIPELARLYGKEVQISIAVDHAEVIPNDRVFINELEEEVELLHTKIQAHLELNRIRHEKVTPEANCVQD